MSTYAPTRCGIARFAGSLANGLGDVHDDMELDVVRLVPAGSPSAVGQVQMEVDPNSAVSMRAAARHLNRCDTVVIQHEFGIFGDGDGESVVGLVQSIDRPALVVLHTVLAAPNERQRRIIEELGARSHLVVLTDAARRILRENYRVDQTVSVIPHGVHFSPRPPNPAPHRRLITWGLLGPGKGLERAIEAVALLDDIRPSIRYRIVGRTHPEVARTQGDSYRESLRQLARDRGVAKRIEFVDRYVEDRELSEMVRDSDLVLVPYDNTDQVSSGVLVEALGLGRPVVATGFPCALEMLASGAGSTVSHNPEAMAAAIRHLLGDSRVYREAVAAAARASRDLSWRSVAKSYADLLVDLAKERATA